MYDVIIVGGGPAGLTAAIYSLRSRFKTLLIEKFILGGQVSIATTIENYPGFGSGIQGPALIMEMEKQVRNIENSEIINETVTGIEQKKELEFAVKTEEKEYLTKTVIICSGRRYRKLGIEKEDNFIGNGISYCATCDAPLYKNKEVVVVGGGDTALEEALHLAKFAGKVKIIHRRGQLRATKILQERMFANNKIEFIQSSVVTGLVITKNESLNMQFVSGVNVKNVVTNAVTEVKCNGIFVCIGFEPNTDFVKSLVWLDTEKYITTDENMQTSLKGIYAAGDCRKKSLKQVVTACSDAATAVFDIEHLLG